MKRETYLEYLHRNGEPLPRPWLVRERVRGVIDRCFGCCPVLLSFVVSVVPFLTASFAGRSSDEMVESSQIVPFPGDAGSSNLFVPRFQGYCKVLGRGYRLFA